MISFVIRASRVSVKAAPVHPRLIEDAVKSMAKQFGGKYKPYKGGAYILFDADSKGNMKVVKVQDEVQGVPALMRSFKGTLDSVEVNKLACVFSF